MSDVLMGEAREWLRSNGRIDVDAFWPVEIPMWMDRLYDGGWAAFKRDNRALRMEIGPRDRETEDAGVNDVVYRHEFRRVINGVSYWFSYTIPSGREAFVRVWRQEYNTHGRMTDTVKVHSFRGVPREMPGVVDFSRRLGGLLGF